MAWRITRLNSARVENIFDYLSDFEVIHECNDNRKQYEKVSNYPGNNGRILLTKSNGVRLPEKCSAAAIEITIQRLCKWAG